MSDTNEQLTVIADRYELQGEIGRGGMGAVYRAKDRQLERLVALKLVAPALAGDQDFEQRLLREAHALARIKDPRVVSVYDAGVHEGRPWFVMELCTDGSLAERMPRGQRLEAGEVRGILEEVAGALTAIHGAGIVHRDLKPANIFRDGRHWKVGDFGIAAASGAATITRTGMVMGTPEYWAPELAMADADTGPEADVYSLGCVLYQALVGEPPFSGPNPLRLGVQHAQDPVPPLPDDVVASDPELAGLVMRMLAKDPSTRPTVPELMGEEVEPAAGGAPATVVAGAAAATGATQAAAASPPPEPPESATPPPGAPPPAAKSDRKKLWLGLAGAAVAVAVIVGVVLAFTLGGGDDGGDDPPEGPMASGFVAGATPQLDTLSDSAGEMASLLARVEDPSQLDDIERAASFELTQVERAQGEIGEIEVTEDEAAQKAALEDAAEAQRNYTAAVAEAVTIPPEDGIQRIPDIRDAASQTVQQYSEFFALAPEAADRITGLDLGFTAALERTLQAEIDNQQPDLPPGDPNVIVGPAFSSPTGNLNCTLQTETFLICARNNDGLNVFFDAENDSITESIAGPEPGGVTVPYGSAWEGGRFRCESEEAGITCTSFLSGSGFFFKRDELTIL